MATTCFRFAQKTITAVKITVMEFNTKEDAAWWVANMLPKDASGFDSWTEHDMSEVSELRKRIGT